MIQRFITQLQDFFGISRKEARGALMLMALIFFLIWTPFVFRRWILPLFPISSEPVNTQKLDSIATELTKPAEKEEGEKFYPKSDYKKTPERPVRLFTFDPNQATLDQLTELGIPAFLARRIDKYRSKGGQFRKKEDLLHIYDFPADLYKNLEPYIKLPQSGSKTFASTAQQKTYANASASFPKTYTNAYSKESKAYVKPVIASFDINTTDTTQLIKLKGIGTKLSLRILKFRDAIGGFYSVNQFSEIYGLDSLAMSELNKYAKVMSPVKKINVNTATMEELSGHSYLRNKKLAAVIINYRTQHGPYNSVEDLKKVKVLDDATIEKLRPYLAF